MNAGFIGLGKMGYNLVNRLYRAGYNLSVYDKYNNNYDLLDEEIKKTEDLDDLCNSIYGKKIILICIPAGKEIDETINQLLKHLSTGDIIIDLSNSFYKDSIRRALLLKEKGIEFLDVGLSGGIEGAANGACLMIGGDLEVFKSVEELFKALSKNSSYSYLGKSGAGHLVKGYHNFIEYGYLQSLAEGLATIELISKENDFNLDLSEVCDIWNKGSIIESKLVKFAKEALKDKKRFEEISGSVYGQTIDEMIELQKIAEEKGVASFACKGSIDARLQYQKNPSIVGKIINAIRNKFGGHEDWKV